MKKVKGLSKTKKKNLHRHRQQYDDDQRERGVGEAEEGKGEQTVTEGGLTWGGEHTTQYTDDIYRTVHLKPI